ncbi:MAG TPA: endonuclease/exonuclease/phosphatase family protein [Burkholderiales bacterium]
MRFKPLAAALVVLVVASFPLRSGSGFGQRFVSASCLAAGAPWMLGETAAAGAESPPAGPVLRLVTFNLHSGLGPGVGFYRTRATVERHLEGIAAAIVETAALPDAVGLNEVDFEARRSGGFDQARYLADALERLAGARYTVVYGETWRRTLPGLEARFGNALLVRHSVLAQAACLYEDADACARGPAGDLPSLRAAGLLDRLTREARGLVRATIDFHDAPVDILVTHLDAFALAEREAQAAHLVRRIVDPSRTTVVLGDFNAVPTVMTHERAFLAADRTHDILTSGALADARVLYAARVGVRDFAAWATYPASAPAWPLDGVLGSLDLLPADVRVVESPYSDHHGLYVEYRLLRDAAAIADQRARHDAIRRRQLARIVDCDLVQAGAAQRRWLATGTGFAEVASGVQRAMLTAPLQEAKRR